MKREPFHPWEAPWNLDDQAVELLFACALRFDGGKYDAALARPGDTYGYDALSRSAARGLDGTFTIGGSVLDQFAALFFHQRSLGREAPDNAGVWLGFLRLFLHLHAEETPRGYASLEYQRQYAAGREAAAGIAARLAPLVEAAIASRGTKTAKGRR